MNVKAIEAIDDIMDHFEFKEALEVMRYLDFGWTDEDTTEGCVRRFARNLMKRAVEGLEKNRSYNIATGGFEVEATEGEGKIYLKLSFVPFEWDNYD